MIIKRLTLNNFRQFVGEQTIIFSTDSKKKATLVIAKNGTGKTTIIESFSWILYGTYKLNSILNSKIRENMQQGAETTISGEIVLEHSGKEYTIVRTQKFKKIGNGIKTDDSVVRLTHKDENGLNKEKRGLDAENEIKSIVPEELFPYFFFKGESIERIGKEINKKGSSNKRFSEAIRGMLGFTWLYNTRNDLKAVLAQYDDELATNSSERGLAELASKEANAKSIKERCEKENDEYERQKAQFKIEKDELNARIIKYSDVADKQKESIELSQTLTNLKGKINQLRKRIFASFSRDAFAIFSNDLIANALEEVNETDDVDKGIPGLEVSAIEYILKQKKCVCGAEVNDHSHAYEELEKLIKYLPPNNIGNEITIFKNYANSVDEKRNRILSDLKDARKNLSERLEDYEKTRSKLNEINKIIENVEDVSEWKKREEQLSKQIENLDRLIGKNEQKIVENTGTIEEIAKQKLKYVVVDARNKKALECQRQTQTLINRIDKFCYVKESEKRHQLQDAINKIYSKVFDMNISITLDENYNISKTATGFSELNDLESSTSQDAILAFAFIGGIIQLARDGATSKEEFDDIGGTEPYPLVMDAPSSSFDIDRIKSFCELMPKIAEQVIFFIKDTDGKYVEEYLNEAIGKRYQFNKIDDYTTEIERY